MYYDVLKVFCLPESSKGGAVVDFIKDTDVTTGDWANSWVWAIWRRQVIFCEEINFIDQEKIGKNDSGSFDSVEVFDELTGPQHKHPEFDIYRTLWI